MTLLPYQSLFDIDRFFEGEELEYGITRPSMDMYEKGAAIVAEMHVPGIDADKIEVSVKDGILHVSGTSQKQKEEKDKGYWKKEIRRGSFERMIRLPAPVQENKIEATCENGILTITMPKAKHVAQKTVKVIARNRKPSKVSTKK